jgi:hypothetical protein
METISNAEVDGVVPKAGRAKSRLRRLSRKARKTHCKHGHPFSGGNLKKLGFHLCKACVAFRAAIARKRAGLPARKATHDRRRASLSQCELVHAL